MTPAARRRLRRPFVAVAAAAGLVVATAAPASAELPFGEDVSAELVGGEINVGPNTFPLGEDQGPTDCNPTGDPSTITASIDENGVVDNFNFDFAASEQELGVTICVQLSVTNQDDLVGQLDENPDGSGTLTIDNPSPVVDVELSGNSIPAGCGLRDIDVGGLTGPVSEPGPPNDATLSTPTFDVPASSSCGIIGGLVDAALGAPCTGCADAVFELLVDVV